MGKFRNGSLGGDYFLLDPLSEKGPAELFHGVQTFANLGVIPEFQVKLTTMRKYGLSCMIFIQAVGQIKNLYKDDWETLMGACDTLVYLGGNELSFMEDLSKKLGQQTNRSRDSSRSHSGKGGSDSKSFKYTKRELLTVDEIRRLKDGYCIIIIKGQQPFYDEKYKTFEHPNAGLLGDLGKGVGLYVFQYCNTKPKNLEKLEKSRNIQQDQAVKRRVESPRQEDQAFQVHTIMPPVKPITEEEQTELAKQLVKQTTVVSFDRSDAVCRGAVVTEAVDGVVSVSDSRPKPQQASAGGRIGKGAVEAKTDVGSMMEGFDMLDSI